MRRAGATLSKSFWTKSLLGKRRTRAEIENDIKYWLAQSDACPYCFDECWCDGGWSPAARLGDLRKELAESKRAKR